MITGNDDPEEMIPWSMPLVFLVDKNAPATVTAICETSAKAVVHLLSTQEPSWRESIENWEEGRIRKVVRRAKAVHLSKVDDLPGISVTANGATVKAFLPTPINALPPQLSKMQVSGSEPPEIGQASAGAWVKIFINPDLKMSVGKKAAQVSHAAQLILRAMTQQEREAWKSSSFSLSVHHSSEEEWAEALKLATISIVDAGLTEIPPGSQTVVAFRA